MLPKAVQISSSRRLAQVSHQLQAPKPFQPLTQRRMASQHASFTLNTGAKIPAVGFGTWQDADAQEGAVLTALKAGYRHIDGARIYGTEPAVGKAIKQSGIPRSEIFITTKLWNNSHEPKDVEPACDASLKDLGTDYLDLYLMHWPAAFEPSETLMPRDENGKIKPSKIDYLDTWKAMEQLQQKGKCKAIGISNFNQAEIDRLLKESSTTPAVHQLELHPWLQQRPFVEYHKSHNIHVTAYSPFGNQNPIYTKGEHLGRLIDDPVLNKIGKKHGKSGAQVALAWGIARGHSVIPKSKTESRIKDNLDVDFKLTAEEVEEINATDKKMRFNDPSGNFGYQFYEGLDGKA